MSLFSKIKRKIAYWMAPYVWKKRPAKNMIMLLSEVKKPFDDEVPKLKDEVVNQSFIGDNKRWDHAEYIKVINEHTYIEPVSGFLIDSNENIIQESIIIDQYDLYPSKQSFSKNKRNIQRHFPETIVFDHGKGSNYFHFYSDTLGKLHMIKEYTPELINLPLIINEDQYNSRHFQFFKKLEEVSRYNWQVQKQNEVWTSDKTYLLQPMPYDRKYWDWIRKMCEPYLKPLSSAKKIFINRPSNTGRHLTNNREIEKVFMDNGYEIVFMENKKIEEQIAIFSSASEIAAIHGAGMTNMVFCDANAKILEVMPDGRISSHYYWLATAIGLNYECILGGEITYNKLRYPKGRFYLDPQKLKEYLS